MILENKLMFKSDLNWDESVFMNHRRKFSMLYIQGLNGEMSNDCVPFFMCKA